ncbi:MAG TPA: sugar isomerase [Streptosporangiaceae bacterium]|nr:sugar isomerase [Streptosporangiaceae bacterium]
MRGSEAYVLEEIASQPDCWARALRSAGEAASILPGRGEKVAVIGCGTSWHVAAAIAAAREAAGHGETDAFPASEVPGRHYGAVLAVTRSGTTTEVLDALAAMPRSVRKIAITADASSPVRDATDQLLVLDYADEKSVVQTRFATTALTVMRAHVGHDLWPVVEQARAAASADLDDRLVDRPHYVFLARGWAVGVAREAALKVQEAASARSEAHPALEYRHGPLSAADESSVVWMLGGADAALVSDVKRTGATVVVAAGDPQAELVLAQRVAVATALVRGLDPDRPRYLARSVVSTGR